MQFIQNGIFHIYNQGNNKQKIFFSPENYLFFLRKMQEHLLPHGDLLCYCLMPNHFHWLFHVREPEIIQTDGVTLSHTDGVTLSQTDGVTQSHPVSRTRTLNDSIGILLRSYTRAINKQENRSGALFREATKAKDGWEDPYVNILHPDFEKVWKNWEIYGNTCFQYIHNNPVKAGLVASALDWEYSSARDFAGLRNGKLCNKEMAIKLLYLPAMK